MKPNVTIMVQYNNWRAQDRESTEYLNDKYFNEPTNLKDIPYEGDDCPGMPNANTTRANGKKPNGKNVV